MAPPWRCLGCLAQLPDDLADRWCDHCRPRLYAALARCLRGAWGFSFGPGLMEIFARPGRGPAHGGRRIPAEVEAEETEGPHGRFEQKTKRWRETHLQR
jgi:hypothetical protein